MMPVPAEVIEGYLVVIGIGDIAPGGFGAGADFDAM